MSTAADAITADLAANLRRYRERSGLSQADLAAKAGYTGPAVSLIETGQRDASIAAVELLANALGIPPRTLLLPPDCAECGDLPEPGCRCMACGKGDRRAS